MRIPYRWLQTHAEGPLPPPEELAEKLTFVGLNVEELIPLCPHPLDGVVMAEITGAEEIAGGELTRCTADAGGHGTYVVVSGAPNCRAGIFVPLALPGARLPDGTLIDKSRVAGVDSEAMLCSAAELGLPLGPADYLLEVDGGERGAPAKEALGLDDVSLDLDLTPNYAAHCQSVLGTAREVDALVGAGVTLPGEEPSGEEEGVSIDDVVSIEVVDPDLCPRYSATLATEVMIEPSPWWMQRDLMACGVRPINNVVDVTNYVMLEYGQPLHAFDLDKVQGARVLVRRARDGERIITLDGEERVLKGDDLVIADTIRAIGIAGVMGGLNSEITENTTRVLLESAYFDPGSIARTSRRLGLRTQASLRFEKGRDPEGTVSPARRALRLMARLGACRPAAGLIDIYPEPLERRRLQLRPGRVNALLGTDLEAEEMVSYLQRLQFSVDDSGDGPMRVSVPSWRSDIESEVCLTEEVARLHGYNEIPADRPLTPISGYTPPRIDRVKGRIRELLVGSGFMETVSYSWMSSSMMDAMGVPENHPHRRAVKIANPMRTEHRYLRTTTLASLLGVLQHNGARRTGEGLRFFEQGVVYLSEEIPPRDLLDEPARLGLAMMGPAEPGFWVAGGGRDGDFYDLKGTLEAILDALHIEDWSVEEASEYHLHPGRAGRLIVAGEAVGSFGELHPDAADRLQLPARAYVAELDLDAVAAAAQLTPREAPLPVHPSSTRDIAIVLEEEISHARTRRTIEEAGGDLLEDARLFDVYRGEQVGEGKKSLAYHLTYRAPDRTLQEAEVEERHGRILEALEEKLDAALRS